MPFLKGDNFIISIFRTGLPPCLMHKSTMTSPCVRLIAELKEQLWFHVSNLASWLKVAPVSSTLIPLYITFTLLVPIIFQQNQNGLFLANTQYLLRILWHGVHFCLWTQIQREYTLSADAYRQLALMENVPLQDESILLSERHGWEVICPSSSDLFLLPMLSQRRKSQMLSEVILFSVYCRAASATLASHLEFLYAKQEQWNSPAWLKQKFCPQIWS